MSCLLDLLFQWIKKRGPGSQSPRPLPREVEVEVEVEMNRPLPPLPDMDEPHCPICLEPIGRKTKNHTMVCRNRPCKTYYHKACFRDWMTHSGSNSPKCLICTLPKVTAYRKRKTRRVPQTRIIYVRPRARPHT